jgi:small multidrug resistance pump
MTKHHAALMAAIIGGIFGQLLLKAGSVGATDLWTQLARVPTWAGLACYGGSAILYLVALQVIPVSIAFPSVALSYAVIAIIGAVYWQEPVGWQQALGIALIFGGVVMLYRH